MNCEHQKVYEDGLLMSNPPQKRWICRNCFEIGYERAGSYEPKRKEWLEFYELLEKAVKARK